MIHIVIIQFEMLLHPPHSSQDKDGRERVYNLRELNLSDGCLSSGSHHHISGCTHLYGV